MIDELAQPFGSLFIIINGRVHEFLKIFQTGFGFIGALGFQSILVACIEDRSLDDVGNR